MRKPKVATAAVAAAMVGVLGFGVPAFAAAGYGNVKIEQKDKTLTIGNDAITRTFSFKDGKLTTTQIENKLGKSTFKPGDGSEEFLIETMAGGVRIEPEKALTSVKPAKAQPQTTVTVKGSSEENGEPAVSQNAIDGDPNSYWASEGDITTDPEFEIAFGKQVSVSSLVYTPRSANGNGFECTGQILTVKVQKKDGDKWTDVKEFTLKSGKEGCANQKLSFDAPVTTEAIKLVVTNSFHWKPEKKGDVANIAEIDCLDANGASLVHPAAQSAWGIETSSDQGTNDGGGIAALIDGQASTYWHSKYNGSGVTGDETPKLPVTVTLDRGTAKTEFKTVGYLPRPNQMSNGNWQEFELYASDDKAKLFEEGNKLKNQYGNTTFSVSYAGMYGADSEAGAKWIYFGLEKPCDKQYVGVKVTKGHGDKFAAGAELDLFSEQFSSVADSTGDTSIKSSELKLEGDPTIDQDKNLVTFDFEPAVFGSGKVDVAMKVAMEDGKHYMRKWVEITPVEGSLDAATRIKYIDGEHLDVTGVDAKKTWTIPTDNGGVVQMPTQRANLGQPVYVNGMFFGSEFPVADTQIVDAQNQGKTARSRYWTGKNFDDFKRDKQLTTDGKFVSWQTVCGASHSDGSDIKVIQSDFFAYIDEISKPSDFRIQYNSWFDNMMRINDENILESFKAVDKHLSETGVRPLESYAVDDGWNNYRHKADQHNDGIGVERNGTAGKVNDTGFWAFNDKFPQGLTPSSSLVKKLGSNFGVWIGPRGGYNYQGTIADLIQEAGNGSKAGGSIDVADQRYVDKFKDMAIKWMKDYDVNYWKWDGFADNGQYGAFTTGDNVAGYSKDHHHMYGGPNGFFHATDLWEKWIVLFDEVWKTADDEQIEDLWVSLTCYVNPSPWFLQWSNSVWIQCVGDRGEVHGGAGDDKMNAMLSYRDACYYEFINTNQYQFPLANVYNHDPIYGKEGTGITADSMNGEQFRNYLFMQGTRGTAFWELYYSDSLFNEEKYLINADFLKWEEGNFDMLRNAKWIGGDPAQEAGLTSGTTVNATKQEAYGFSGFNTAGNEGIISMRNPANAPRTLEFTLADAIGCTENGTYKVVLDHVYTQGGKKAAEAPKTINKGDKVTIELQPGETQIWHLSKDGDTAAPILSKLYTENNTTLRVQASEHVYGAQFEVFVNGEKIELADDAVKAYADLKTFDIALPSARPEGSTIEVKAVAGADSAGNKLSGSIDRAFHTDNIVGKVMKEQCPNLATISGSIKGSDGFSATAIVENVPANTVLVSQGDEWKLGIDAEGYAYFTVGDVTAKSAAKVEGSTSVAGVRENNGVLKVYVGGQIEGNAYDAQKSVDHDVKPAAIKANTIGGVTVATVYDRALGYDEIPTAPLSELIKTVEGVKDKVDPQSWADNNIDALLKNAKDALAGNDAAAQQKAYEELLAGYNKLVPGMGEAKTVNLALGKDVVARWKSDDSNAAGNNDRPVGMAVDGTKNTTDNYAEFGNDNKAETSYLQVDLGAVTDVTSVHLVRYYGDKRTYPNTTVVLSQDDKFDASDIIVFNSDKDNKNGFGAGEQEAYAESAEGKTFDVPAGTKARYVRVYMNGRGSQGNTNHVVELEVMGPENATLGDPYGVDSLDALIARGETALQNEGKYTPESIEALKAPLAAAKELSASLHKQIEAQQFTTTYGEFNSVRDALQAAIGCLQSKVEKLFNVTFEDGLDGIANLVISVPEGGTVARPSDPIRPGYTFGGWFTDVACTKAYDFATPVTGDITLYAKWSKDGSASTTPDVKPSKPGSNSGLPQTGDNSLVVIGGVAVAAAAALGGGLYLKRRRG